MGGKNYSFIKLCLISHVQTHTKHTNEKGFIIVTNGFNVYSIASR